MGQRLRDATRALCAGEIDFAEYTRRTAPDWNATAAYLIRRWGLPLGACHEDVVQELHLGAWASVSKWDPDWPGASPVERFVYWSAITRTKKWLHVQRGAGLSGNPDRKPSRAPLLLRDPGKWREEGESAMQEEHVDLRRLQATVVARAESMREACAQLALFARAGDVTAAAAALYGDVTARREARLGSEREAERVVRSAFRAMVSRVRAA